MSLIPIFIYDNGQADLLAIDNINIPVIGQIPGTPLVHTVMNVNGHVHQRQVERLLQDQPYGEGDVVQQAHPNDGRGQLLLHVRALRDDCIDVWHQDEEHRRHRVRRGMQERHELREDDKTHDDRRSYPSISYTFPKIMTTSAAAAIIGSTSCRACPSQT